MAQNAKQKREVEDKADLEENTLLFEQDYAKGRVVQTPKGFDIEFAVLGGASFSVFEETEMTARSIYAGLDVVYRAKLADVQKEMLAMLEQLSDEAREGEPSNIGLPADTKDTEVDES